MNNYADYGAWIKVASQVEMTGAFIVIKKEKRIMKK
jgi:hypothetical protein